MIQTKSDPTIKSKCCDADFEGEGICPICGNEAEWMEEEPAFKVYGLTERVRAGMSMEPNGDLFVDD